MTWEPGDLPDRQSPFDLRGWGGGFVAPSAPAGGNRQSSALFRKRGRELFCFDCDARWEMERDVARENAAYRRDDRTHRDAIRENVATGNDDGHRGNAGQPPCLSRHVRAGLHRNDAENR